MDRLSDSIARARAAFDESGRTAAAQAAARYRYSVDFTIGRELVDVRALDVRNGPHGCEVHLEFSGTEAARRRVLDVVSRLPSFRRSYRMNYEPEGGEVQDGQGKEHLVD